jgi:hypothetical protein
LIKWHFAMGWWKPARTYGLHLWTSTSTP